MSDERTGAQPADDGREAGAGATTPPRPPLPPRGPVPPLPSPVDAPRYGQYAPPSPGYAPPGAAPNAYPAPGGYAQPGGYPPPGAYPPPGGYGPPPGGDPYGRNPFAGGGYGAPGGQQWAPPPKPGLIPLRPLGFGTLIGAPFQVLRRNPKATVGSALLVQGVTVVVTILVVGIVTFLTMSRVAQASAEDRDAVAAGAVLAILLSALVPIALSIVGSVFVQGVVVTEVARGTLGEKRRMRELWRATWPRMGWLLLWTLVTTLAVLIGAGAVAGVVALLVMGGGGLIALGVVVGILGGLGLVAVMVWLGTKLAIVPSVLVMERASLSKAVARSWSLTNGSFWKTFGVLALVSIILSVAAQVVTTPISLVAGFIPALMDPTGSDATAMLATYLVLELLIVVISVVVQAIVSVVQSAAVALVYIDLRMRKEGLDIRLQRFVEARQVGDESVADPYLPETEPAGPGATWG